MWGRPWWQEGSRESREEAAAVVQAGDETDRTRVGTVTTVR